MDPDMFNRANWGIVFLLFVVAACDMLGGPRDKVAIRVGDSKITLSQVRRDMEEFGVDMGLKWEEVHPMLDQLLNRLVERYLILAYGREKRIEVEQRELLKVVNDIKSSYVSEDGFKEMLLERYIDFAVWKEQLREQILITKIIDEGTADVEPVTYKEIEAYYNENKDQFRHPAMVRFRQMIGSTAKDAEVVLEHIGKGEGLEKLIRDTPESLERLVAVPERWSTKDELEETLGKALFRMPVGMSGKVIKTPYGYHIIEILEKREEGLLRLPDVVDEIEEKLLAEKKEIRYRKWIDVLKSRYPVEVDRDVIESLGA
jgi:parvulin-like peptidyl-prolyl isomerase